MATKNHNQVVLGITEQNLREFAKQQIQFVNNMRSKCQEFKERLNDIEPNSEESVRLQSYITMLENNINIMSQMESTYTIKENVANKRNDDVKKIRKGNVVTFNKPVMHPQCNMVIIPAGEHAVSMRGVTFVELWLGGCDYHQISLAQLKYEIEKGNATIK